eukprot:TRINITY_DN736_c0_g3_i2.p1 TRINITY_DN736_c0_g3~~TRINITY_DN736_c0_g3_i2.p1  ORF type:complete len:1108 (+),score=347.26 TRINITY_DN736_c0_g3_i2:93-3416(+)
MTEVEKKVRALRKKLRALEDLEKKAKTTKLDEQQKEKLKRKDDLLNQIKMLKEGQAIPDDANDANGASNGASNEEANGKSPSKSSKKAKAKEVEEVEETKQDDDLSPQEVELAAKFDKEIKKIEKRLRQIKQLQEKDPSTLDDAQREKLKTMKGVEKKLRKVEKEKAEAMEKLREELKDDSSSSTSTVSVSSDDEEDENPFAVDRSCLDALYAELDNCEEIQKKVKRGIIKKSKLNQYQKTLIEKIPKLEEAIKKEEERIANEEAKLRVAAGLSAEPEPESDDEAPAEEEAAEEAAPEEEPAKEAEPEEEEKPEEKPKTPEEEPIEEKPKTPEEEPVEQPKTPEEEPIEKPKTPVQEPKKEPKKKKKSEPEAEKAKAPEKPKPKPKPKTAEELGFKFKAGNKKTESEPSPKSGAEDIMADDGVPQKKFSEMIQVEEATTSFTFGAAPAVKKNTTRATREGILAKQATKRLHKDLRDLHDSPLYTVHIDSDDLFRWHVNITPSEGPFAGYIIHFVIYFPDSYPHEAPDIRCSVPIRHPCVVFTNELCLEINSVQKGRDSRGKWSPAYTARTVLSHLCSMFGDDLLSEKFFTLTNDDKKQNRKEDHWWKRLDSDKAAIQSYVCRENGHSLASPSPAAPCLNGPFDCELPQNIQVQNGCVWTVGECKVAGHYWEHNFSGAGKHYFRTVLRHRGGEHPPLWVIGYTTPHGSITSFGADDCSWGYEPTTGKLKYGGNEVETGVTAGPGDIVDCYLDIDAGEITFSVNGTLIPEKMTDILPGELYHPSFCFGRDSGGELIFVTNSSILPASSLPCASVSSIVDSEPSCYITKEGVDECLLGVGLTVTRKEMVVEHIIPEYDMISHEAFAKSGKTSINGGTLHAFFPRLLGAHHGVKARPLLERAVAEILRNPKAKLPAGYTPPFKPSNVNNVMSLMLQGVVTSFEPHMSKGPKEYAMDKCIEMYSHTIHAYKTLAGFYPSVIEDAEKVLKMSPNNGAIAMPVVNADGMVQVLLRKAFENCDTLADCYKGGKQKSKVNIILILDVLRRLFENTTAEDLTSLNGKPPATHVENFKKCMVALKEATSIQQAVEACDLALSEDDCAALLLPLEGAES